MSKSKSRRPRASQQCGSDTWCSWELLPSRTSVRQPEVVLWRPTPSLLWSASPRSTAIRCVDPTEVGGHTLAQEVRCGASGHVPTQILRERAYRSGRKGSRETASIVFSHPFFVKGEHCVHKDVPLPDDFDLQAALQKAKSVGPSIHGVVLRGKGLGLRTKECDFKSVVGQVYTEEEGTPRGLSGKDGRLSTRLSLGSKWWCRYSWLGWSCTAF